MCLKQEEVIAVFTVTFPNFSEALEGCRNGNAILGGDTCLVWPTRVIVTAQTPCPPERRARPQTPPDQMAETQLDEMTPSESDETTAAMQEVSH